MTKPTTAATLSSTLDALEAALDQSQEVKAKVEACAEDLAEASDLATARMARGATTLPAVEVLLNSKAIELKVQDCAADLQQVAENLAHGVNEVKEVEQALSRSREALADSQAALEASRSAERTANQRAMHDQQTGLPNRALFDDRLEQAIAGADRHGWILAVMFMDLDRFKLVNDNHGHAVGDAVLKAVAKRLTKHARDEDTVCRNGGDEFLYLLINPMNRENVARIAGLLRASVAAPIDIGSVQFVVTPSIGIALYPDHGLTGQKLIANADAAMYRAKRMRSACEFFEAPVASGIPLSPP
jgi:diguanylate cyclase